jgi:heptosyltransferase-1
VNLRVDPNRAVPARILIVRLSAIGDIVFASPLIAALRRAYPDAHLAWLVQPEYRALLDGHPDLDEVIVCPLGHWRRLWRERRLAALRTGVVAMRETLRAAHFDLALDLQGLLKSGILTWLTGAPERVGLGSREGSRWLMTQTVPRGGDLARIGSEYLFLAQSLGLPTDDFAMAVPPCEADRAAAQALITREGLDGGYAVLCPFTTRPQKHWIEARWAPLAARLHGELGLRPVVLGGPADRAAGARIRDAAAGVPLLDLTGRTGLGEAAALVARADLVIGVDTGLAHMGIAFGRPSLLLFGSTRPYLDTTRANARVIYQPLDCSPCKRRPTCGGDFTCMRLIEVCTLIEAARDLLSGPA